MKDLSDKEIKTIKPLSGVEAILSQPTISDVILVGVTDEQGIREMKDEGFVPLGWDPAVGAEPLDIEALYHGTEEDNHEDRQAGGSEDETQG